MEAPRVLRWSTEEVDNAVRIPYWVDAISDAMFGMTSVPLEPKDFNGTITVAPLESIWVSTSNGNDRISGRSKLNIARDTSYSYHIMANFRSPWVWEWRGRSMHLNIGDVVFSDTRFLQTAYLTGGTTNIKLPPSWATTWLRDPERLAGRRLARDTGWGAALSAYVAQLSPTMVVDLPLPPRVVADNLGALLALVETELLNLEPAYSPGERLMRDRIHDVIHQRASEPGLTGAAVASDMNISERTLHRCLASSGSTFGNLLIQARMDLARRMLDASHFGRLTTGEIGRRAGFLDPSHFVRVSARYLGTTPRRYRQCRLESAGQEVTDESD